MKPPKPSPDTKAEENGENVHNLRQGAPYRPMRRQGVDLAFGFDEIDGDLVFRLPDGTFMRFDLGDLLEDDDG